MFRIRIHKFLGLPDRDPLGRGADTDSDLYPGSSYHQASIIKKTLDFNSLWLLYGLLYLKNDLNAPFEQKNTNNFLLPSWRSLTQRAGSRSVSQRYGSEDPDPYQYVTDPKHCYTVLLPIAGKRTRTSTHWHSLNTNLRSVVGRVDSVLIADSWLQS